MKWIARPGLVRGLDRRGLCLMAGLGIDEVGRVEPYMGLGGYRRRVTPQAVSYGLLPTSLVRIKCGRGIYRGHVPAANTSDRSPVFVGLDFLTAVGVKKLVADK